MLSPAELGPYLNARATRMLFRLESLASYEVPSEGSDFARYLAGEQAPSLERRQPWLDRLRGEVARGLHRRRVHSVHLPLSDYLRFECEWSYALNPYEDIRILVLDGRPDLERLVERAGGDFFLADDAHVVRLHYTADNRPLGAEGDSTPDVVAQYRDLAGRLWAAAEPFEQWWVTHPEFHRASRAA